MNANKLFSEFSIKKIWDKLLQHDKAMNSTILVLSSGNWVDQEDGTFKNTVSYKGFTENDKLTVDFYDDGNLSETQLNEYEQYIDSFETIDGALVAIANIKPTQSMTVVVKGDFMANEASVENVGDLISAINQTNEELEKTNEALGGYCFYKDPAVVCLAADNSPYIDENKNYVLSESTSGAALLEDSETYVSSTVEGSFYRIEGADTVTPFSAGGMDLEEYKKQVVDAMSTTSYGLTYDSTWEEILTAMGDAFSRKYVSQSGSLFVQHRANTSGTWTATFPTPFLETPTITYSISGDYGHAVSRYISAQSATGFSWYSGGDGRGDEIPTYYIHWTAKGYIAYDASV